MKNRSVIEIMVLTFTFVIAIIIVAMSVLVCVVEIRDPKADTSALVKTLEGIMVLILGALLGLLAGKAATVAVDLSQRPEEKSPGQHRVVEEGEEEGDILP
jgi:hypothetical protein